MFRVIDTGKDARIGTGVWGICEFSTLEKAIRYANKWLYKYGPLPKDYKVGDKFFYSGCEAGDSWIQIIEQNDVPKVESAPKEVAPAMVS